MKVSKNNYPNVHQLGDILTLNKSELLQLGEIDLLIGGSPCQGFSRSGKQLNFKDPDIIQLDSQHLFLKTKNIIIDV